MNRGLLIGPLYVMMNEYGDKGGGLTGRLSTR